MNSISAHPLERVRGRPPAPPELELAKAIVKSVAYADIFDYPLTAVEVHRYLAGVPVSAQIVANTLQHGHLLPRYLSQRQGYYTLPGREGIISLRQERASLASELWPHARRYGSMIGRLPFVRMVAVTGSLAMDNPGDDADIDLLVVTRDDRLWLCRALVILVVRLAAGRGVGLCPNYFLAERALLFPVHNLYAAHEVAQMVPITGLAMYRRVRQLNDWVDAFLPNAAGPPRRIEPVAGGRRPLRTLEDLPLAGFVGQRLEQWEMGRKLRKFHAAAGGAAESSFSADWCKGHFEAHHERIITAYQARLEALSLADFD